MNEVREIKKPRPLEEIKTEAQPLLNKLGLTEAGETEKQEVRERLNQLHAELYLLNCKTSKDSAEAKIIAELADKIERALSSQ